MTKSELENTEEILKNIIMQKVDTIELEEQILPKIEELKYSNKSYKVKCSILFIDIRESTQLSKNLADKSMLKIYKSFIRMATQCVRYSGGYTRQFLGDRIMGIFLDDIDEENNVIRKSSDKAVNSAKEMNTYIDYVLNNLISKNINGKYIKCGIGICTGSVLLAQVGMKGLEQDDDKQNEKGDVWVGYITNQASKFADLALAREVFIDETTYIKLGENNKKYKGKELWHKEKRMKSNKIYSGYVTKNLYVDNIDELELVRLEYLEENKIKNDLVEALEEKISSCAIKETLLESKERQLKNEENRLKIERQNIDIQIKEGEYTLLRNLLSETYLNSDAVKGCEKFWIKKIDETIEVGNKIGLSKEEVEKDICLYMASIYYYTGLYNEAYEYIILHTEISTWFCTCLAEDIIRKTKLKQRLLSVLKEKYNNVQDKNAKLEYQKDIERIEKMEY